MDLQSIAPTTKTVPLGRGTVEIKGLSLRKLTDLIVRYPDLLALASGKTDLANLLVVAPEAMLAIFSVGTVEPRKLRWFEFWNWFRAERSEKALLDAYDAASTGQQIDILAQIFELTFAGESARPFLAAVLNMIAAP